MPHVIATRRVRECGHHVHSPATCGLCRRCETHPEYGAARRLADPPPARKPLPLRLVACAHYGDKVRPDCDCRERFCHRGFGGRVGVRLLEECQTCPEYVARPRTIPPPAPAIPQPVIPQPAARGPLWPDAVRLLVAGLVAGMVAGLVGWLVR